LQVRLLGGFAVGLGDRHVPEGAWRLRRAKSLIKLLALSPVRRAHRRRVAELLWPDQDLDVAVRNVTQVTYVARRALDVVGDDRGRVLVLRDEVLALEGPLEVDVEVFEAAAAAAVCGNDVEACRRALDLYGGELLPEDHFEQWTAARRDSVRETYLGLLVRVAELHTDDLAAIEAFERAVVEDPLHEAAHRGLMRRFVAVGRQQQALAQYQRLQRTLRAELAAEPDLQTRRLYQEILRGQAGSKELVEAPAAPQARAPARRGVGLPHQLTSFVGRERELRELAGTLARTRLLTLTGPGGCGKTRLALELAAGGTGAFEGGVRLVELAPIADPALVAEETATALDVQLRERHDPLGVLAEQIGERSLLLVLDNCEHVIAACAELAARLLAGCPRLRVLATSREPLRVGGEVAWRVPSLPVPAHGTGPDLVGRLESVRLFVDRAGDAAPGFALDAENAAAVAEVCRRLDGMPLALELAAARVTTYSPAQIAARLDDSLGLLTAGNRAARTRQQTLRATLAWSYDLLDDDERRLCRGLGVFAGSFSAAAVEGICGALVRVLPRLVDKSLVQVERGRGEHRYRLLEPVRQYARELLAESGETNVVEASHRAFYLALAEANDANATGESGWPERLEPEHDDLRAALVSALENDSSAALRLAVALFWFWMARGHFSEGARWTDAALGADPEPTTLRGRALVASAGLDTRLGRQDRRIVTVREAIELFEGMGDLFGAADAYRLLGTYVLDMRDDATAAFDRGAELAARAGDSTRLAGVHQAHGVFSYLEGHAATARSFFTQAAQLLSGGAADEAPAFEVQLLSSMTVPEGPGERLRAFFEYTYLVGRLVGPRLGAAFLACNVALLDRSDGDLTAAREGLECALAMFRDLGDPMGTSLALHALGNLARPSGEFGLGREWLEEALWLRRQRGDWREIALTISSLGLLALRAGEQDEGWRQLAEARTIFARTRDAPGLAGIALNRGVATLDAGDPGRAVVLLTEAVQRLQTIRYFPWMVGAPVLLAEAALAVGDLRLARDALVTAGAALGTADTPWVARAADLKAELAARMSES
jgi:predicted ATPase/DNA-binding SARP family transcriptional activator